MPASPTVAYPVKWIEISTGGKPALVRDLYLSRWQNATDLLEASAYIIPISFTCNSLRSITNYRKISSERLMYSRKLIHGTETVAMLHTAGIFLLESS